MSGGERAGADDFAGGRLRGTQGLGWEPPDDSGAEFGQAQGGAAQAISPGAFFYKLSVLRHSDFESRQLVYKLGNQFRLYLHLLADYQGSVESERGDEVTGLELPIGIRAINDFESDS